MILLNLNHITDLNLIVLMGFTSRMFLRLTLKNKSRAQGFAKFYMQSSLKKEYSIISMRKNQPIKIVFILFFNQIDDQQ